MGAAASVPSSVEEAKAQGFLQADIDAYLSKSKVGDAARLAFADVDTDNSGGVCVKELPRLFKRLGLADADNDNYTGITARHLKHFDLNKDSILQYDEFVALYNYLVEDSVRAAQLRHDKNLSGGSRQKRPGTSHGVNDQEILGSLPLSRSDSQHTLPSARLDEVKGLFDSADTDKSGVVDKDELLALLRRLKPGCEAERAASWLKRHDLDNSNALSFIEFANLVASVDHSMRPSTAELLGEDQLPTPRNSGWFFAAARKKDERRQRRRRRRRRRRGEGDEGEGDGEASDKKKKRREKHRRKRRKEGGGDGADEDEDEDERRRRRKQRHRDRKKKRRKRKKKEKDLNKEWAPPGGEIDAPIATNIIALARADLSPEPAAAGDEGRASPTDTLLSNIDKLNAKAVARGGPTDALALAREAERQRQLNEVNAVSAKNAAVAAKKAKEVAAAMKDENAVLREKLAATEAAAAKAEAAAAAAATAAAAAAAAAAAKEKSGHGSSSDGTLSSSDEGHHHHHHRHRRRHRQSQASLMRARSKKDMHEHAPDKAPPPRKEGADASLLEAKRAKVEAAMEKHMTVLRIGEDGWVECWAQKYEQVYYFNDNTGESTWILPPDAKFPDEDESDHTLSSSDWTSSEWSTSDDEYDLLSETDEDNKGQAQDADVAKKSSKLEAKVSSTKKAKGKETKTTTVVESKQANAAKQAAARQRTLAEQEEAQQQSAQQPTAAELAAAAVVASMG